MCGCNLSRNTTTQLRQVIQAMYGSNFQDMAIPPPLQQSRATYSDTFLPNHI